MTKKIPRRDMPNIDRDRAIMLIQAVRELHDRTARLIIDSGDQPSVDSQARRELQAYRERASVNIAMSQANILIEVAADQLGAFTRVAEEPVQTIAPWTCMRALLEGCALACWLLDPKISARQRIQRGFAFDFATLIWPLSII